MKLRSILNELFSDKTLYSKNIKWTIQSREREWKGKFIVDNCQFDLEFSANNVAHFLSYGNLSSQYASYGNKIIWDVVFNVSGEDPDYKDSKVNPFKVFSIVGEGVVELIKREKPPFLLITYPTNAAERKDLYNKFAKIIEKKFDYQKIDENKIGIFMKRMDI